MTDPASSDVESILASYRPTEVQFQIPEEATIDVETQQQPPTRYKAGAPLASSIEPLTRTIKVANLDIAPYLSDAGVRGMVTNVSHGTYNSRPASLVVFSFSLRSGDHAFRFKNANVKITFAKQPSTPASELSPAILKFAPRKIFGLPTVEGKKNRIGGEIALQVPAGPIMVGPKVNGEREWEYEKDYRFRTIGNFWSSKHETDWNIVYWDMRENKKTKHGIPDRLNVAVVVERQGSFTASVEVTVDTPLLNGIFAFPWSKRSPVPFSPTAVIGEQPKTLEYEQLTDADWRGMIPYEEEWENKFTEETLRTGTRIPIPVSTAEDGAPKASAMPAVDYKQLEAEESDDR